jgi:trimethylamine--corrinoid protein Co-methyltransferase
MPGETPPLQPIKPSYHIRILSDAQLATMKSATLQILEEVGIHCPSEKVRAIYAAHGAQVDAETHIVRFPPDVVLDAMSHAPRGYTMGARHPDFDLHLDGTALYCATDGCGIETVDFETREQRPSTKGDCAKMARISDYLSSIAFYWPIVSAQDFPETAPLHELDASFNNTIKHVQSETVMDGIMARHAVEMAKVIAGDEKTLRERPPLSLLVCAIAPLGQDEGGMEAALTFAEAGLPVGFMSMATAGSTAPATVAGTLATGDAEVVAAMALIQMAYPGASVYHSMMPAMMHPMTGGYLGTAWETSLFSPVGVELAHMWGVPTLIGAFGGDAIALGWESAKWVGASLTLCALLGAETGSGMGLLEGSTVLYPEAVVLDTDIYHHIRIAAAGLDTSAEALGLDVIKAVGPRGHFLGQKHTRAQLRQREFSDVTNQRAADGSYRDPVEVAREKTDWILANHQPEPLSDSQQAELKRILAAAERELA